MKKIVVLLLAIMMCFIGIACGNDAEKTDKDKATHSATVVETQKPTATPLYLGDITFDMANTPNK